MRPDPSAVLTRAPGEPIVNDFSIQVATVNGSGSQTANLVLLRSIFQMGVPVSRQEHVPVEHRRACRPGTRSAPTRTATSRRKKEIDFLVAMNAGDGARKTC